MSCFLYFLPGAQHIPALPPASGLPQILAGGSLSWVNVEGSGPDGHHGAICAISGAHAPRVGYYKDRQTWVPVETSDGTVTHWLGWETGNLPGPTELLRGKAPEGHDVELGDGHAWRIPSVKAHIPELVTLPQRMRLSARGELSFDPVAGYEALSEESAWWYDVFSNGGTYTFDRYWQYACMLLGVSYHVGREELNSLGILLKNREQIERVVYASLGVPDLLDQVEAQKKMSEQPPPGT